MRRGQRGSRSIGIGPETDGGVSLEDIRPDSPPMVVREERALPRSSRFTQGFIFWKKRSVDATVPPPVFYMNSIRPAEDGPSTQRRSPAKMDDSYLLATGLENQRM